MKDIKERVRDKNPKIRNPAARLPKELVRSAVLEAKEKPRELHEKSSGQSESPTQYGTEKIESVQYRAASVAGKSIGKTTYQGGKKLAGVTYRKIKERKSRQEEAKAAEEAMEQEVVLTHLTRHRMPAVTVTEKQLTAEDPVEVRMEVQLREMVLFRV